MKNSKVEAAINAQINAEFWSAYLYLAMSADFAAKGMPGFANWMYVQFQEEQAHAIKLFNYIISRGGKPELKPIDGVQTAWNTPLEVFKEILSHEQKVTSMMNELYALANSEKDYATVSILQWFITEQAEEENTAKGLIDTLTMIGDNGFGIYTLDKELSARVFVPAAAL